MAIEALTQTTVREAEVVLESPFYIPMTGPAARPRRSLKHDDTFIVLDSHGDIGASAGGPDGLFNADTRYLARLELVLDEVQPLLLGSNLRDDNSSLTVDLTNPDIYGNGRIVLQKDMLHIVRTIFLWRGTAYQRIGVQNHGDRLASFDLTLLFDNDFADLFEVRGERRPRRGIGFSKMLGSADVSLEYDGLDGKSRCTALQFDPRPTRLAVNAVTYHLDLAPQQVSSMFVVGILQQAGRYVQAGSVFSRIAGASSRDAPLDCGRRQHRNLKQYLQRGAVSVDGRPQHVDDGYAAGTISLCGHSLVLDDLRPRRNYYRTANVVDRPADRTRRAEAARILSGQNRSTRSPTPNLEKFCMKCAAARWLICARCRLRNITAASMRLRCSCCWPVCMSNAPAMTKRSPNCGLRSKRRCGGSTAPAIPTGTDLSSTGARRNRAWPIKAGRIPTTRSFMPTAVSPKVISRLPKCRAMYSPANCWQHVARRVLAKMTRRTRSEPKPSFSPSALKKRSGATNSAPMRSRSMAPNNHAEYAHRTQGNCCSAAWFGKTAPERSPPI